METYEQFMERCKRRLTGGTDYVDEEPKCEYFIAPGDPNFNVCRGNEPHSCHRAKKEGECWKKRKAAK